MAQQQNVIASNQNCDSDQSSIVESIQIPNVLPSEPSAKVDVQVYCGAANMNLEGLEAGVTAKEIREACQESLNIAPDAEMYVEGVKVTDEYIFEKTEQIEFIKIAGQKG